METKMKKQNGARQAQSVKVAKGKNSVLFAVNLVAYIRKEKEGGYFVYCPALDVGSQGDTIAEAKENIAEATQCFLEGCYEMGTLNEVLLESGFARETKKQPRKTRAKNIAGNWDREFPFTKQIPLAAAYC